MHKIKRFNNQIFSQESDDDLSIIDRLPNTVSWYCDETLFEISNENKVIAVLLNNGNQIAIIESPYNKIANKAYIVDSLGRIVVNIKTLFEETYAHLYNVTQAIFTDVYYSNSKLFFFLVLNNVDFRLEMNITEMKLGDLIESR